MDSNKRFDPRALVETEVVSQDISQGEKDQEIERQKDQKVRDVLKQIREKNRQKEEAKAG